MADTDDPARFILWRRLDGRKVAGKPRLKRIARTFGAQAAAQGAFYLVLLENHGKGWIPYVMFSAGKPEFAVGPPYDRIHDAKQAAAVKIIGYATGGASA